MRRLLSKRMPAVMRVGVCPLFDPLGELAPSDQARLVEELAACSGLQSVATFRELCGDTLLTLQKDFPAKGFDQWEIRPNDEVAPEEALLLPQTKSLTMRDVEVTHSDWACGGFGDLIVPSDLDIRETITLRGKRLHVVSSANARVSGDLSDFDIPESMKECNELIEDAYDLSLLISVQ